MQHSRLSMRVFRCGTFAMAFLTLAAAMFGCAAAHAGAVDLSIKQADFPGDDAVILKWEQYWTIKTDGTVQRRDHKWVKLFNVRPIDRYGDPRLAFVNEQEELIIHKAQTTTADGTVLPVPDYSFNIAAPDEIVGWPEYAAWRDQIVSFSGIEADCVLELDYEVVTPAGVLPWLEGDVRLNDEYPIVERLVSVTVPTEGPFHYQIDRDPGAQFGKTSTVVGWGPATTYAWKMQDLAGARAEHHAPVWQMQCPRLRFTTCADLETWERATAGRVNQAGAGNGTIKEFAEATVEGEPDAAERVRLLAKKIHDSFNFVSDAKAMHGLSCRPAADVLQANYGNRLESAALLLAAVRSLGIDASAMVGVPSAAWDKSDEVVPIASGIDAVVVADVEDGPMYVHPQHGVFMNPGSWGRHWLIGRDAAGSLVTNYIHARGEKKPSDLQIAGKITIDKDGKASGDMRIRATGAFYVPKRLETAGAQKSQVTGTVGHVLSGLDVTSHSVAKLSEKVFKATASVASADALETYGGRHMLKLGDGPAFLGSIPLPLGASERRSDVWIGGRLNEQVDLLIELPEEWQAVIVPESLEPITGRWGRAVQTVEIDGKNVHFHREITIDRERVSAAEFAGLREAVNKLKATRSLVLAVGK